MKEKNKKYTLFFMSILSFWYTIMTNNNKYKWLKDILKQLNEGNEDDLDTKKPENNELFENINSNPATEQELDDARIWWDTDHTKPLSYNEYETQLSHDEQKKELFSLLDEMIERWCIENDKLNLFKIYVWNIFPEDKKSIIEAVQFAEQMAEQNSENTNLHIFSPILLKTLRMWIKDIEFKNLLNQ